MKSLFSGQSFEPEEEQGGPRLQFTRDAQLESISDENLTDKALQNLQQRRMRLKQSEFFSGEQEEVEEAGDDDEYMENEEGIQRIDLAKQQTKEQED